MSILGPNFENIKVVQKSGFRMIKGDVGGDRMVFAINSDLFLVEFDSKINKWSMDQGQKTINPLIRKLKSLSQGPPQWSPNHPCPFDCIF